MTLSVLYLLSQQTIFYPRRIPSHVELFWTSALSSLTKLILMMISSSLPINCLQSQPNLLLALSLFKGRPSRKRYLNIYHSRPPEPTSFTTPLEKLLVKKKYFKTPSPPIKSKTCLSTQFINYSSKGTPFETLFTYSKHYSSKQTCNTLCIQFNALPSFSSPLSLSATNIWDNEHWNFNCQHHPRSDHRQTPRVPRPDQKIRQCKMV